MIERLRESDNDTEWVMPLGEGEPSRRPTLAWEAAAEIEALRLLVAECRSSVKFDLLHYEKMARAYGNIGPEGAEKHAMADGEAQRLHALLEKIDALAPTTPNDEVRGASRLSGEASSAEGATSTVVLEGYNQRRT